MSLLWILTLSLFQGTAFADACPDPGKDPSSLIIRSATPAGDLFLEIPYQADNATYHLNALLVRPDDPNESSIFLKAKKPLILITHGAQLNPADNHKVRIEQFLVQGRSLANTGLNVVIVERRGYGRSQEAYAEDPGPLEAPRRDYLKSVREGAKDLSGVLGYLSAYRFVDCSKVIGMGQSAGGYAVLYWGAQNIQGLLGVVGFAAGRGAKGDGGLWAPQDVFEVFKVMGSTMKIPNLWMYSGNDSLFPPSLAEQFFEAFKQAGGSGEFKMLGGFKNQGHFFFADPDGIPMWFTKVDQFIRNIIRLQPTPAALTSMNRDFPSVGGGKPRRFVLMDQILGTNQN